MIVKQISKAYAIQYIRTHHYSKILPKLTKYYLGFYDNEHIIGVVTLGWGTQPLQTIKKIFPRHNINTSDYLEIGKMCFSKQNNNDQKSGSQILSLLKKWVIKNTECLYLYTLADGIMGKVGIVYQASSYHYLGYFMTSVYMDNITMEKIHPKSARKLLEENAIFEKKKKVYWLTHCFCKYKNISKINGKMFRYIIPLNKKAKKILLSYKIELDYPKKEDLLFKKRIAHNKYIKIPMPKFNTNISNYNFQKWDNEQIVFDI